MKKVLFYGESEDLLLVLQKAFSMSETEVSPVFSDEELMRILSQENTDLLVLQKHSASIDFDYIARRQHSDARLSVLLVPFDEELTTVRPYAEEKGLFVVSKPVLCEQTDAIFSLLRSFRNKTAELYREKEKLNHKLLENRLTDRAKCILIQHLKLTEAQAHKYIEKQAMDLRISREKVAQIILQTYEQS